MKFLRFISKGKLKNGKLILDNPRWFRTCLLKYDDTEKIRIVVEKERGARSKRANNYYWGVVLPLIAAHIGETSEDLHEIFKSKYLRKKRVWRGGEITILQSTTKLNSIEFGEYIERVIQEGAELGVVVPFADKEYRVHEQFPESRG